ncbi:MAG: proton-conducting transporter membrane subunit [Polyangiaceae bacterium]
MNDSTAWQLVGRAIALTIPLMFGVAAFASRSSRSSPLRQATVATYLGWVLALSVASTQVFASLGGLQWLPQFAARPSLGIRLDIVTTIMLSLVCGIGLVIARYSCTYLQGDPGQRRYARWFLATLGAVTLLVVSNNLLVIALAWTATSLALHQLLTFYSDRRTALVAAHKKFLVSRLADVCLLTATALVGLTVGSVELDAIAHWVGSHESLPRPLQLAAVLIVIAVSLRSAQLPFHGWLIQVMEAPTPVSALLHAGVVNIGGFVLIRLAPFMAHAIVAQTLLVGIGTLTTVLAALVMTTRVSIKVSLAWSTCVAGHSEERESGCVSLGLTALLAAARSLASLAR